MINTDKWENATTKLVNWSKMLGIVALVGLVGVSLLFRSSSDDTKDDRATKATVMITNMTGNSGGTGVVVSISNNETEILTNSHVCALLKAGGKITTTYGETHVAKYYNQDADHDLCLVVIAAKLKTAAKVATTRPGLYDSAAISGHPNLLPAVVTRGHFTKNQVISVFTGIEKCTDEEMKNSELVDICYFFGGMPVVKAYEATVVTALIMAGSSGSAVYNSNNELSGLAFAGNQGISYAYIVPFEYVTSFLDKNLGGKNRNNFKSPNYKLDILSLLRGENKQKRTLLKKCEDTTNNNPVIENLCKVIIDTIKWRK